MLPKITWKTVLVSLIVIAIICGFNLFSDYMTTLNLTLRTQESNKIAQSSSDAYITTDLVHKTDTLIVGENFFLHNSYHRFEMCYYHVAITMLGDDNHVSISLRDVTNWLPTGDYEFNDLFTVPDGTPEGTYTIKKRLINYCGKDIYYTDLVNASVHIHALHQANR